MTDEQLACFRPYFNDCPIGMNRKECKNQKTCESCWIKWLKSEQTFTFDVLEDGTFLAKELGV